MQVAKRVYQEHSDERGSLVSIEGEHDVPFVVKRVYYMYGIAKGAKRGCHAHRSLEQLLVCVHGSCRVTLNDGRERTETRLAHPNEGLYIGPGVWREIYDFSPDAVLIVLASDHYDESDIIRDYEQFLGEASLGEVNE